MTTYPNLPTTDETAELEDAAELQAYRDGLGQLAEDPMHAGQPVHECSNAWDDAKYFLQVTHQDMPLWGCQVCAKHTLTTTRVEPEKCAGCGSVDSCEPLLYPAAAACRSWTKSYGGEYDGPCLIAGSDGCECGEQDR
jgi:hypothetical protein